MGRRVIVVAGLVKVSGPSPSEQADEPSLPHRLDSARRTRGGAHVGARKIATRWWTTRSGDARGGAGPVAGNLRPRRGAPREGRCARGFR